MSTAQTYLVAHSARAKLTREAGKADHDLRLLVGHANLLDGLMFQLAEQEREQESWFNSTVAASQPAPAAADSHVRWAAEPIREEDESESDSDDEIVPAIPARAMYPAPAYRIVDDDDDDSSDEEDDDEEDLESLALVRTHSNVMTSPPALVHDSDSDDEDDIASPPTQVFEEFPQKGKAASGIAAREEALFHDGPLFLAPTVSAY